MMYFLSKRLLKSIPKSDVQVQEVIHDEKTPSSAISPVCVAEHKEDLRDQHRDSDTTLFEQDGSLDGKTIAIDEQIDQQPVKTTTTPTTGPVYSVFSKNQKLFIACMAAWAGFFSTVSANIYFPALNSLAKDLHVSDTLINLTLTSYMIFQGLAPAFIGDLADSLGRRVAYTVCFTLYIAANVGLALQNNYASLFILRCLQSSGSSATIAMASAVVSDIATASERGSYMGFTLAGALVGPALGPVAGGLLSQYMGWRAIFWFLVIFASSFMIIFGIFFPETARNQVGNGSIPPTGLNMSLMNYLAVRKARTANIESKEVDSNRKTETQDISLKRRKFRFPNPLSSLYIFFDKENALLLSYNAFLFAAFYDVTASMPSQFREIYHFNDMHLGLCYIPFGVGSLCACLISGKIVDRNYKRWCRRLGVEIRKGHTEDLRDFPIEKVRLQIALPAAYIACILVVAFGWTMDLPRHPSLAAMLVILFFTSFSMTIAFTVMGTLLVDFYPKSPATATATNNLTRCLLGAAATAAIVPMIDGMGRGWTFTFLAFFLIITSPMLWAVYYWGMEWRRERWIREEESSKKKQGAKAEENRGGDDDDHHHHDVEANIGAGDAPVVIGGYGSDIGIITQGTDDDESREGKAIGVDHVEDKHTIDEK